MLIILYIIVFGIQFMIGHVQLATREVVSRLIKLGLVWTFATNSAYGIDIAYNFFIGAADQGIAWMLSTIMPPLANVPPAWTERVAFAYIDQLVYGAITGPFTVGGAKLAGIIGVMSFAFPPLFMLFFYFTTRTIVIFVRALLSYLLGISAIAFLISLSPIFLSLALFQATSRFFEDWLRFLISFTLQIILIFAGVAMWLAVIGTLGNFFAQLANLVVPVQDILEASPVRSPVDSWGLCSFDSVMTAFGPQLMCVNGPIIYPSQIVNEPQFIYFVALNMITLCLVVYAFDKLLDHIPALARSLSGPAYAPQLGGGRGLGAINYPGLSSLTNARQSFETNFNNSGGSLFDRVSNGFSGGKGAVDQFKQGAGEQITKR
jgi:hypothetical protein